METSNVFSPNFGSIGWTPCVAAPRVVDSSQTADVVQARSDEVVHLGQLAGDSTDTRSARLRVPV